MRVISCVGTVFEPGIWSVLSDSWAPSSPGTRESRVLSCSLTKPCHQEGAWKLWDLELPCFAFCASFECSAQTWLPAGEGSLVVPSSFLLYCCPRSRLTYIQHVHNRHGCCFCVAHIRHSGHTLSICSAQTIRNSVCRPHITQRCVQCMVTRAGGPLHQTQQA